MFAPKSTSNRDMQMFVAVLLQPVLLHNHIKLCDGQCEKVLDVSPSATTAVIPTLSIKCRCSVVANQVIERPR